VTPLGRTVGYNGCTVRPVVLLYGPTGHLPCRGKVTAINGAQGGTTEIIATEGVLKR
jgi:hypothetical protein